MRYGAEFVCFNTAMDEPVEVTTPQPDVGDTVQVLRPDGSTESGIVVEDFADYALSGDAIGRDWAMPRRWAVATVEGTLIFVDDGDIVEHSTGRSAS